MKEQTKRYLEHYRNVFREHGRSARGVDWTNDREQEFRYRRMMNVMLLDPDPPAGKVSVLDVGCGWGGLYEYCGKSGLDVDYTGIDLVSEMIEEGSRSFPDAEFSTGDIFAMGDDRKFDYVVCNGILTLKLELGLREMEEYALSLIDRMYSLCRHGVAFNQMSDKVNFFQDDGYYVNPGERFLQCLRDFSPRVVLDHGYNSLGMEDRRRMFDFMVFLFRCDGGPR